MTTTDEERVELVTVRVCPDCDEVTEEGDEGPAVYECGSCGTTFNRDNSADGESSRCPVCHKFSAKVADESCGSGCDAGLEDEERWRCNECEQYYGTREEALACCPPDEDDEERGEGEARPKPPKRCAICKQPTEVGVDRCGVHRPRAVIVEVHRETPETFRAARTPHIGTIWSIEEIEEDIAKRFPDGRTLIHLKNPHEAGDGSVDACWEYGNGVMRENHRRHARMLVEPNHTVVRDGRAYREPNGDPADCWCCRNPYAMTVEMAIKRFEPGLKRREPQLIIERIEDPERWLPVFPERAHEFVITVGPEGQDSSCTWCGVDEADAFSRESVICSVDPETRARLIEDAARADEEGGAS